MRFLVDIRRVDGDRVEGEVRRADAAADQHFSGWLELCGILERDADASAVREVDDS